MGAGHDGAARELCQRVEAQGHDARFVDFMTMAPCKIGALVRWGYEAQLRVAPWAYEATYRMWYLLPFLLRPVVGFVTLLTRRRLLREARDWRADVVVTTYPLGSLTLGRAREKGLLTVPAATFVTDFAVHPLWVHPGVDANICVHESSAETAAARTGRPSTAPGPLVAARFQLDRGSCGRDATRASLGIGPDEKVVLVVAGSWGVGAVEQTFDTLLASGRFTPLAVCGRNERLRRRLEARHAGIVVGWTDDMPSLMAASDVLVQNAGGLTCMEAFAVGLPVVSYNPIPGHGRENAIDMDRAGVAAYAKTAAELLPTLDAATGVGGRRSVTAGRAMFRGDAADQVLALAATPRAGDELAARRATRPLRTRIASRVAVAMVAAVASWTAVTAGVGTATAYGIGVAHPPRHADAAFVGVRLNRDALGDQRVVDALAAAHFTAIVPAVSVRTVDMQRLVAAGIDVANGGWGRDDMRRWTRARADVVRADHTIRAATGVRCRDFVPQRRVDGFDLASARFAHERVVVPRHRLGAGQLPAQLDAGQVYVIDAAGENVDAALAMLADLHTALTTGHVRALPLADLR